MNPGVEFGFGDNVGSWYSTGIQILQIMKYLGVGPMQHCNYLLGGHSQHSKGRTDSRPPQKASWMQPEGLPTPQKSLRMTGLHWHRLEVPSSHIRRCSETLQPRTLKSTNPKPVDKDSPLYLVNKVSIN